MTWKTGIAAGHIAFLDQLEAFLCGAGLAFGLNYTGTGTGTLTGVDGTRGGYVGGTASVAETFTITATSSTEFDVVGSVAGSIGTATVGTVFDHARVKFLISAGGTAFVAGDQFKLSTCPPWTMVRRCGALPSMRSTSMTNGARLWDGVAGGGLAASSYPASATSLPATATIAMIGPSRCRRVSVSIGATPANGPGSFALEYSDDDGATWVQAQAWTGVTWAAWETRGFGAVDAGEHERWRVIFTATAGGGTLEVTELRFFRGTTGDVELQARAEAVLMAPGNAGGEQIYIGLEVYEDAAAAARGFNFYQFRAFGESAAVRSQASNSGLRNVPLTDNAFTWWAAANGRRIAAVAKIGAVYVPLYQGFGKPYELPSVHPYPAVNAGTGNSEFGVATSTSPNFRGFSSPGRYGMVARYPDNQWRQHANRYQTGSGDGGDNVTTGKVYPTAMSPGGRLPDMRESLDGSRPLYELVLVCTSPAHTWGELDGCYWTPGFNLIPEQVIPFEGFDHKVFQNTFRNADADFFAIRQD